MLVQNTKNKNVWRADFLTEKCFPLRKARSLGYGTSLFHPKTKCGIEFFYVAHIKTFGPRSHLRVIFFCITFFFFF